MLKVYRLVITAHHDFVRVVHDQLYTREATADSAGNEIVAKLAKLEGALFKDSYEWRVIPETIIGG